MFDYLDNMPDLQFMLIFVVLIVAAYAAEWLFDLWSGGAGKEKGGPTSARRGGGVQ